MLSTTSCRPGRTCCGGADVRLGDDVLDRIDEIVPPGVDLHTADLFIEPTPPIQDKRLRRRREAD